MDCKVVEVTSRENNFDLIRLLAALQVMAIHSAEHLVSVSPTTFPMSALGLFPGVPVFFFMSGFLICGSWIRNPDWKAYASNRIIRIYPALWFCLALTVCLALYHVGPSFLATHSFFGWLIAQLTCGQFCNLNAFRDIGVGTINGSLWTISIELQFYCLLPIIASTFFASGRRLYLWIVLVAALLFRELYISLRLSHFDVMPMKLFGATVLPYLSLFCIGIVCQLYWGRIQRVFEGKFWWWFIGYTSWACIGSAFGYASYGNRMSFLFYIPLCGLVLATAFSYTKLSEKLLRGHDLSYGIYLYHMLAINFVLERQIETPALRCFLVATISFAFAMVSWTMIERPCLQWKQRLRRNGSNRAVLAQGNQFLSDVLSSSRKEIL